MANLDITRHLLSRQFHYTGTRMQQGRALLESDWNEDAVLVGEDRRLTLVDLIGAQGSSNAGFAVVDVTGASASEPIEYDFCLRPGSLFVGGLRFVVDPSGESFRSQTDWIRHDLEGDKPTQPQLSELTPDPTLRANSPFKAVTAPPKYRYDLVYLLGWEQPVTAVEDSELRERALGGPDSAARTRRMRRVYVLTDVGTECPDEAVEVLGQGVTHATYDRETAELISNARLTVKPVAPSGELPCGSQTPTGYVGHEDEAIRVELRGTNKITWGFGDAAPLYRVKIGADRKRITFLNKPRDLRRQPKSNQVVEIVPWGAKLPNGEKVAELTGELFRVLDGYDPASDEITLTDRVPETWIEWLVDHRADWDPQDGDDGKFFYLRVWDRGADTTSPLLIDVGTAGVELGKTGLAVSLEGLGNSGDYWVIGARRGTPDVVVPWRLLASEAPHGPRMFMTPLAIIRWEAPLKFMKEADLAEIDQTKHVSIVFNDNLAAVWGPVKGVPIDARRRLQRLCVGGGCCTITVGDGNSSHGLVNSLSDAVDLLPSSGGRICLLRGQHTGPVVLDGLENVEIYGDGELSQLVNTPPGTPGTEFTYAQAPLISLQDCTNVKLRGFTTVAHSATSVRIDSGCSEVSIERLWLNQHGSYDSGLGEFALPQPAVLSLGGTKVSVRDCRVEVDDVLSYSGALVLGGQGVRIHNNWVQAGAFESATVAKSMGGIHVLSQSQEVEVVGNVVHGGWGHGVSLGHVVAWTATPMSSETISLADIWTAAERGLGEPVTHLFNYSPDASAPVGTPGTSNDWTSGGRLVDVRIDRNRVTGMGLSGISTTMLGLEHGTDIGTNPAFIVAARLSITNNLIVGNRRITTIDPGVCEPRADGCYDTVVGGIVISAAIDTIVAENRVIDNGGDDDMPNCGLGFVAMQNLVIRDNYVVDNGYEPTAAVPEGLRGGIAIMEITGSRGPDSTFFETVHYNVSLAENPEVDPHTTKVALRVHKNEVVQRSGRALWVLRVFDDAIVTENTLTSKGDLALNVGIGTFELAYAIPSAMPLVVELAAAGACVEMLGFSLAPDIDWDEDVGSTPPGVMMVEPGAEASVGGTIEFSGNHGLLDWATNVGGYASAYLISSQDSVVLADNVLVANLHAGDGAFDDGFLTTTVDEPGDKSFVITNCYVGTVGGALVRGNRFIEDTRGALLSVIVGPTFQAPTATQDVRNGVILTSCIGSHCSVTFDPAVGTKVATPYVHIHEAPMGCPGPEDPLTDPYIIKVTH